MDAAVPIRWEALAAPDLSAVLERSCGLALLPVGATEQHGGHLPTGTDTLSVDTVAAAASARTGVPLLPTLPYGCSQGHSRSWPGTISLRPDTLRRIALEVADWAHSSGVQRLLILNGHYTNFAPLRCALEDIRVDLPDMRIGLRSLWTLSPAIHDHYHEDGANWHGNHAETSLCLHWAPDQVHMDRAVDEPDRAQAMDAVFSYRVDQETPTGIVGRPSTANADSGAGFADELVAALVALLERAKTEDTPIDWAAKRPEFS